MKVSYRNFRAFLFAYLEKLLNLFNSGNSNDKILASEELDRLKKIVVDSKDELVSIGYSEIAIESFHDVSVSEHFKSCL